ncbi:MAG TPA: 4-(cytidine 5'-diphospho)-2-C-methyl-D-erythritol kinase [Clostridiales bacterium]|nr:4-(cytidine 5'-diphospho)-2-C-methyl-D-erythritol kinase [Clostridiales bacterium]
MTMIKLNSYGKINLFLDIKGKLHNGYHIINTVMQSIDIYDEIILAPINDNKIIIECSDLSIPINEKNTCYKAALILKKNYGINSGIHIYISKKIPAGAGMAGGSSNAAAVIRGLNVMWKLNLSEDEMSGIGAQIGADVPFCLVGGTCFAEGLGDKITEIDDFVWNNILIVKPEFSISTAYVYQNTAPGYYNSYASNDILKYISSHNYENAARCVSNTMERVVEKFHPEINDIKKLMIDNGAVSSIMTGSGSAVFALFKDNDSLNKAYLIAKKIYPSTFKSKTCKYGVKFID